MVEVLAVVELDAGGAEAVALGTGLDEMVAAAVFEVLVVGELDKVVVDVTEAASLGEALIEATAVVGSLAVEELDTHAAGVAEASSVGLAAANVEVEVLAEK